MELGGTIIEDLENKLSDDEMQEQFDIWLQDQKDKGLEMIHIPSSYDEL